MYRLYRKKKKKKKMTHLWSFYIFRTAEGFEKCSQNKGRAGYLPLESNISNWSNAAYLKTKVHMLLFTIKHCQFFTLTKGHGAGVTVGKCMRMEIFFFLRSDPVFFPPFSLSFSPFSFTFSCAFPMLGHLSCTWLVLTGLRYKDTTVIRTFFLTWEAFHALSLPARELVLILLLTRILPY